MNCKDKNYFQASAEGAGVKLKNGNMVAVLDLEPNDRDSVIGLKFVRPDSNNPDKPYVTNIALSLEAVVALAQLLWMNRTVTDGLLKAFANGDTIDAESAK